MISCRDRRSFSILPEILEPLGRQLRVAHRVLGIAVTELILNEPQVVAIVGQVGVRGATTQDY